MKKQQDKDQVFSVRLPQRLVRRVRVYAAAHDREIREVVREALERSLPKIEVSA